MKLEIIVVLIIGTAAMFGIMAFLRKWYAGLQIWKLALSSIFLTASGTAGAYLLYFIENGKWGGISFYGSLFVIPILFIVISPLMRIQYGTLLDISAPCVSFMLALNKVNCVRTGCCKGIILKTNPDGSVERFPSQLVELIAALIICGVLIYLITKCKLRGIVYPSFLVIYGVTRFIFNLLRDVDPWIWILPAGNFWSLASIVLGVLWIVFARKKRLIGN